MEEGFTSTELDDTLIRYAESKFSKEKNDWKVMDIDYEVLR